MIRPVLCGEGFLAEVAATATEEAGFRLWWLGQSGYLLQWQGRHVLLDPYLSDSLTEKYAGTERPHVRLTERVIAPERLDFIDVATSSHNHTDHLDAATLGPLLRASPRMHLVIPEANRAFVAARLGVPASLPIGLDDGRSAEVGGFRFTGVAAAHETVERDAAGCCRYLGYLVRFGPWCLYHSGDTVRYPGMAERLAGCGIDVALLPINGAVAARGVAGNLSGPEAAALAADSGAALVIPCHYEMFAFNTAAPDEFRRAAERLGQPYALLAAGQRWSSAGGLGLGRA